MKNGLFRERVAGRDEPQPAYVSWDRPATPGPDLPLGESLARCARFFWAGLSRHGQTGGIVPSQRFLIEKMIAPVPVNYPGLVVELGAGTGVLTVRLATRCCKARIIACEINPVLARDTEALLANAGVDGNVRVANEPAEALLSRLSARPKGRPDFIISGIPLGNLRRDAALELIDAIHGALPDGGLYIQFQYSFLDREKVRSRFRHLTTVPALLNFPPAFVYYARK